METKNSVILQPREKLILYGARHLTDKELLAILLGTGIQGKNVFVLAEEVLKILDGNNYKTSIRDLLTISGLGKAKSTLISASLELSRRILCPDRKKITSPADAIPLISHYSDRKQEHFLCVSLNGAHEVIQVRVVSMGLVNRTLVHPREIFSDPLMDRAAAVLIAHNHPSGNIEPSQEDIEITRRIKNAGVILGIELLDHIIFTDNAYYSFLEEGKI
ncbi:MAG: DNA repair protein RadC, partial [Spirochaetales bacterium]|nr:DNA repair protein RadC [Spirochaetales bacterium]